jgi:hypothetical protein
MRRKKGQNLGEIKDEGQGKKQGKQKEIEEEK